MRYWLLFLILITSTEIHAQNWAGYESGNFSGVNGIFHQPAEISGSPFKADINVFSLNATLYGDDIIPNYNIFKSLNGSAIADYAKLLDVESNDFAVKSTVLLPSAMYSINEKSSIAFSWGIKAFNLNKTSQLAIKDILSDAIDSELADQTYSNEFIRSYMLSWTEFNFSYARVMLDRDQHRLRIGSTGKLLQGIGSLAVEIGDMDFQLEGDSALSNLSLNARYIYNDKIDKIVNGEGFDLLGNTGFAFDFGIVYEFGQIEVRDKSYPDYRFKLGFAVNDLGSIKFTTAERRDFSAAIENVSLSSFQGISTVEELTDTLDRIFDIDDAESGGKYRVKIPSTVSLQFDYNFGKHFFVNLDLFARLNKLSFNTSIIPNIYGFRLVPRYEDNAFGAYLPLEYASKQNFNAGLAFRWKGFIIGSDNILSRWFYKDQAVGDIYVSFKVPLLKKEFQYPRRLHDKRQLKKEVKKEEKKK